MSALSQKPYLDVHVVDHCNLRCRGCVHFAPLAAPRCIDLDAYEGELELLGKVAGIGRYLEAITLMGGEPLLNPQLPAVVRLTRSYLSDAPIAVASHGLLLRQMGDDFWQALSSCETSLYLSPYPIKLDYEALLELAWEHGVRAVLTADVTGTGDNKEAFFHLALDPTGACEPLHAFNRCPFGGRYLQLRDGALWPCQVAALHGALNARFGCAFQSSPDDCLPLEEIASTDQIEDFRRHAHPMCRYCDNDHLTVTGWQRSKCDASEWLVSR